MRKPGARDRSTWTAPAWECPAPEYFLLSVAVLKGLPWVGGKNPDAPNKVCQWVASHLPPVSDECWGYAEPYAGMLGVLLTRPRARWEMVNDLDGRVAAWWRSVRDHPEELSRLILASPYSREEFKTAQAILAEGGCSDLETARCLSVVMLQSFGAAGQGWATGLRDDRLRTDNQIKQMEAMGRRIAALSDRLRLVEVENDDALTLIAKHGGISGLVWYVDPPYSSSHGDYYAVQHGQDGDAERHLSELDDLLLKTAGKVCVSGYEGEHPKLEASGWLKASTGSWTTVGPRHSPRDECLWMNYEASQMSLF